MLAALDITTIYTCFLFVMIASAGTMAVVWFNNPHSHSARYWTFTYLLGIAAGAMLIVWQQLGGYVVIFSTLIVFASHWLLWAGFRSFNNQSASKLVLLGASLLYLILVALNPSLYLDLNLNTSVHSVFIGTASLISAYTVFKGPISRGLPITLPATIILTTHGLFRFAFLYFAVFDPSPIVDGRMAAPWWKIFLLEIFFNTTLMAISTVILIKDRSEQLHRVASETDVLTGIDNRRAFVEKTKNAMQTAAPSSVLAVLDLDYFKKINDAHGHAAGDKALVEFSKTVNKYLPENAFFGRMGGEEFCIYLPSGSCEPLGVLENVRKQVSVTDIDYQGTVIRLTLSIGVATVEAVGNSFEALFASADHALYIAKQDGRNRVTLFAHSQRLREMISHGANQEERLVPSIHGTHI